MIKYSAIFFRKTWRKFHWIHSKSLVIKDYFWCIYFRQFWYIYFRQASREMLKTSDSALGSQHIPQELANNINAQKTQPCFIPILSVYRGSYGP